MKYTQKDGQTVLFFFKKTVSPHAELIGSLAKGKESDHDIDIHLPETKRKDRRVKDIKRLLEAERYELTDWGGVFFYNTFFGDIDVFFKGNTNGFDY